MRGFLFFLILLVSLSSQAQDQALKERQWLKLLHFETDAWGVYESQVDSSNFFLSSQGKKDPQSEFTATKLALLKDGPNTPEEDRIQCRFPARYFYFKKNYPEEAWPAFNCSRFEKFFSALRGESVSLIFSSYYLNNPASAFGHTFLRINKSPDSKGQRYELLDYGVNYSAVMDTNNALVYAVKGLFGGFRGSFTSVPYYYKVREYNDSESRDLWEYELTLSPEEVDLLIAHMWELGPTIIDYWYLTENCSYHMLSILEAAKPSLHLLDRLKKYVIPSDTVHLVWQTPGLVKNINYRPSVRTQFFQRVEKLSFHQQELVSQLVAGESDFLEKNSTSDQALILDAAIDYVDFKYFNYIQKKSGTEDVQELQAAGNSKFYGLKQKLLTLRSEVNYVSEPLVVTPKDRDRPHIGHGSRRAGLGILNHQNQSRSFLFDYKYSHHDLLDSIPGYPEYALMTFWDLGFSYTERSRKFDLDRWTLFEVVSFNPISRFSRSVSWRINIGIEKERWLGCDDCRYLHLSGGPGYSFEFGDSPKFMGYLGYKLWTGHIQERDEPRWQLAGGPNGIFRLRIKENQIALLEVWRWNNPLRETKWGWQNRLAYQWGITNEWAIRAQVNDFGFDREGQMSLFYFH